MLITLERGHADGTFTAPRKPRTGDHVPCATCGTPFYRQKWAVEIARYCSVACKNDGQRRAAPILRCQQCRAPMRFSPSRTAGRRFCSRACYVLGAQQPKNPTGRIHNGRHVVKNTHGYLTVYEPTHPNANRMGRVLEHRLVMSRVLGRALLPTEHVDHINGSKDDNRPENLQILSPNDHSRKTNADQQRARAKILAEVEAYRAKYGPLALE